MPFAENITVHAARLAMLLVEVPLNNGDLPLFIPAMPLM